jgi:hypothetical protein
LRSRGFTAIAHDVELAAVDDDFGPCDCARFARSQTKSRHARNAWQRFAPKSQCGDCLKISRSPNFTGGMPLQRKQRIVAVHAAAVVDHANQRNSAATDHDIDFTSACVDAVFDQFFHYRRRAFHHFAGRHLAGHGLRQQSNPAHFVNKVVHASRLQNPEKIRNPNIEIRNKHEFKNRNAQNWAKRIAGLVLSFGIRICFGIRYSIFGFLCWSRVLT